MIKKSKVYFLINNVPCFGFVKDKDKDSLFIVKVEYVDPSKYYPEIEPKVVVKNKSEVFFSQGELNAFLSSKEMLRHYKEMKEKISRTSSQAYKNMLKMRSLEERIKLNNEGNTLQKENLNDIKKEIERIKFFVSVTVLGLFFTIIVMLVFFCLTI